MWNDIIPRQFRWKFSKNKNKQTTVNCGKKLTPGTTQSDWKLTLKKEENNLVATEMYVDSRPHKVSGNNSGLKMDNLSFKLNAINLRWLPQAQSFTRVRATFKYSLCGVVHASSWSWKLDWLLITVLDYVGFHVCRIHSFIYYLSRSAS